MNYEIKMHNVESVVALERFPSGCLGRIYDFNVQITRRTVPMFFILVGISVSQRKPFASRSYSLHCKDAKTTFPVLPYDAVGNFASRRKRYSNGFHRDAKEFDVKKLRSRRMDTSCVCGARVPLLVMSYVTYLFAYFRHLDSEQIKSRNF